MAVILRETARLMMDSDTVGHFPELLFMKHTTIKITIPIIRTGVFQPEKKGSDYKHTEEFFRLHLPIACL